MKIVKIHHPYNVAQIPAEEVVLVLGFFDGVHRGHQEVIKRGKKEAIDRGLKLAVMTFNQHPSVVFQKVDEESMKYLTSVNQKCDKMSDLGVDLLFIEFTSSFASLHPQQFVDQYMIGLHAKVVVAGFDYTYGPRDIASMPLLSNYSKNRFDIICVEKQEQDNEKISSTKIRNLLDNGQMKAVTQQLGYYFETTGLVVHGDARGRLLGYPTANIKTKSTVRLPKFGVYVVEILVDGQWHPGMAQIGHNITFEENRLMTVEVNILDFNQDIYGEKVNVRWHHYLRGELKFNGVEELIQQLDKDKLDTQNYFAERM